MVDPRILVPATELAAKNTVSFPKESSAYREARNALLAEEIELRRHIERVAELRRALPPGGEIPQNYEVEGEAGPTTFDQLFGDKQTLAVYSFMFPPQRPRPCPVCTSLLSAWDGTARNLRERIALVVFARSPIDRLLDFKRERGWVNLQLYSDITGDYTRNYVSAEDEDYPGLNIFTRRDGTIRHFWGGEMGGSMADPGQDPRGAPDIDPLWTILDLTPEGRGTDWYPKLEYTTPPLMKIEMSESAVPISAGSS
ncbi:DUF899 family protein [Terriglobus saanensis]|uniref:Thioredoxin domain-containing protein n=1 Tax=Terriglobus saanensis (strain ATCC BAA-1853 / DSM 23119 / SP1PR4) TaxID=401053 RepID=E8V2Q1_TERSS|nr:DUF899 family protein [Terriglobus saanensis]ADV83526.1 protein of unknown function DUF899 thioredoxin family protein [Terriglobus saanensis SP1PR4]